ncbi:MFS transporter, partial [Streptomyces anulatus]|nr:MFS transporter [Streptomyces anulatus]
AAQAGPLVSAAQEAFVDGLRSAAGVGAAVLLAAAVAAWFLLRGQKLEEGVEHP